jgi:hypothetical protein
LEFFAAASQEIRAPITWRIAIAADFGPSRKGIESIQQKSLDNEVSIMRILSTFLLLFPCLAYGNAAPAAPSTASRQGNSAIARSTSLFDVRDYPSIAATVAAASAAGGGEVFIPPGSYAISDLVIPPAIRLQGIRGATILKCTGASDGLVISARYAGDIAIQYLTLEADSASCGKAIYFSNATEGAGGIFIGDVSVTRSGSGIWAYGLWSTFWESSDVSSLRIFQSAATAIHMENASNLVRFHGLDITGASSANPIFQRGIELINSEPQFGGTVQGYFADSAIAVSGNEGFSSAAFFGLDVEDANISSTDGANIVIRGVSNVSLIHIVGGPSVTVTGIVRGCNIEGGRLGAIVFDAQVQNCMVMNGRAAFITDNSHYNGWMNEENTSGAAYKTKMPFSDVEAPGATSASLAAK